MGPGVWRRVVVLGALGLLCGGALGCGNNDTGSQPAADMAGGGEDMQVDMRQPEVDMPVTPVDMGVDQGQPQDMPADMPAGGEDMAADMAVEEDMAADMFMAPDLPAYPCAFPASDPACPSGDGYGPGSFVTRFEIATDEQCCHDLDGDGTNDNFIGSNIISLASSFGGVDVNANIQAAISQGRLIYLLEYDHFDNDRYDGSLGLKFLTGGDAMPPFGDNLVGSGSFMVDPNSYDSQGQPLWAFTSAYVIDGMLHAEGGQLQIYFPGLVEEVDLALRNVVLDATVTPGADLAEGGKVVLTDGRLSGGLMMERFYDSMNVVANACTCLGQDIFTKKYSTVNGQQQPYYDCALSASACANDPDDACRTVGDRQLCFFLGVASKNADVDTDGDGVRDALSFGTRIEATGTTLVQFR